MSSSGKMLGPLKCQTLVLAILSIVAFMGTSIPSAIAQEKTFLPSGHAYAPNDERLPFLNSRRDRIQAEADVYETEIYRRQLDESKRSQRLKRLRDHDFFSPDQLQ